MSLLIVRSRRAGLLVLAILVGTGLYFSWRLTGGSSDRHGAENLHRGGHRHGHRQPREVEPPYPTLSLEVIRKDGRRILRLRTERFRFIAPGETAPKAAHAGHGHLEVDDESIAMFYTNRYVLPRFQPGTYTLRVTLNGPDHAPLAVEGRAVADTVILDVERTLPAPGEARSGRRSMPDPAGPPLAVKPPMALPGWRLRWGFTGGLVRGKLRSAKTAGG